MKLTTKGAASVLKIMNAQGVQWFPKYIVVENAAPTKVVMTGLMTDTLSVAADFTISGFTINSLTRDATNKIITLTLSASVTHSDSLTVVYNGLSYPVVNNVAP